MTNKELYEKLAYKTKNVYTQLSSDEKKEMFDMCEYVGLNPIEYLGDVKFEESTES